MDLTLRKNLDRNLTSDEVDANFEELEAAVNSISQGAGTAYATRALAMLEDPLPVDGTPFVVYGETDHNGQYRFDSGEVDGYVLISRFYEVENGIVDGSEKLAKSGDVYKGFLRDKLTLYTTATSLNGFNIERVGNDMVVTLTGDWFIMKGQTDHSNKYCRVHNSSSPRQFIIPQYTKLYLDKSAITNLLSGDIIPDSAYNIVDNTAQDAFLADYKFDKILLYEWYNNTNEASGLFHDKFLTKLAIDSITEDAVLKKRQETQFQIFNQHPTSGNIDVEFNNGDAVITITGDMLLHTGYTTSNGPYTRIVGTQGSTKVITVPKYNSLYLDIAAALSNLTSEDLPDSAYTMTGGVANVSMIDPYPTDKILLFSNWGQDFKSASGLIKDYIVGKGSVVTPKIPLSNLNQAIYDKLPIFVNKYAYGLNQTAENPINIIMVGDSLFARESHTSILDVVPSENPPSLVTKNIGAYINEYIQGLKPLYSRYDKAGIFTEVGGFTETTTDATWDDNGDRPVHTKLSTDANASIEFTTSKPYFNFIDRIENAGSPVNTVSITGGNGRVEARKEGDVLWLEANGFTFSQDKADFGGTGSGYGNTRYARRIEFKKVGAGIGANDTITISKGNDATRLLYWGIEEIESNKPYTRVINVARGGHKLDQLSSYIEDDIYARNPTLIILEIPLLNMIASNSTLEYNLNELQDFVWGDRVGNLNSNSLKNRSNNWVDFNVLLVIPHHSKAHFNADSTFLKQPSGYTAEEIYKSIKGLIYSKGDLPYIDISTAFLNEIDADSTFTDRYSAMGSSGTAGAGYFNDSLHQNDKGTTVWVKQLCPILQLN